MSWYQEEATGAREILKKKTSPLGLGLKEKKKLNALHKHTVCLGFWKEYEKSLWKLKL